MQCLPALSSLHISEVTACRGHTLGHIVGCTGGEPQRSKRPKVSTQALRAVQTNPLSQKRESPLCRSLVCTIHADTSTVINLLYRDTVSSVGIIPGPSLPETTTGMEHVCACRHSLSADERRCKFQPELANGGRGPSSQAGGPGNVKEVWFAGSHSDM